MNAIFGRHAIVTLDTCADCLTLRTLDAQHGRSCRMFVDGDKLYRWLDKPDGSSFMDYDCGSFIVMHRRDRQLSRLPTVHIARLRHWTNCIAAH